MQMVGINQFLLRFSTLIVHFIVGQRLWEFCRGVDNRPLQNAARQSVGAEINWGVRFEQEDQVPKFVQELAMEVETRMKRIKTKGRCITVKVKRKLYSGEPYKLLGCGECLDLSRRLELSRSVDSAEVIGKESIRIIRDLKIPCTELRGIGIHVSKLDETSEPVVPPGQTRLDFKPALKRKSDELKEQPQQQTKIPRVTPPPPEQFESPQKGPMPTIMPSPSPPKVNMNEYLPSFSQIDPDVLKSLPKNIQDELQNVLQQGPKKSSAAINQSKQSIKGLFVDPTVPVFASCTEPRQTRSLLQSWVKCYSIPKTIDVLYLSDYLQSLVRNWQLDDATDYIRTLDRLVRSYKKSTGWCHTLKELKKLVNRESKMVYGRGIHHGCT
jgi:DNA repair protein REV1